MAFPPIKNALVFGEWLKDAARRQAEEQIDDWISRGMNVPTSEEEHERMVAHLAKEMEDYILHEASISVKH
jgi:hypothetical protein